MSMLIVLSPFYWVYVYKILVYDAYIHSFMRSQKSCPCGDCCLMYKTKPRALQVKIRCETDGDMFHAAVQSRAFTVLVRSLLELSKGTDRP